MKEKCQDCNTMLTNPFSKEWKLCKTCQDKRVKKQVEEQRLIRQARGIY
jgi:hypothetical protein